MGTEAERKNLLKILYAIPYLQKIQDINLLFPGYILLSSSCHVCCKVKGNEKRNKVWRKILFSQFKML